MEPKNLNSHLLLSVVLCFFIGFGVQAQNPNNTLQAKIDYAKGDSLYKKRDFQGAASYYEKAVEVYENSIDLLKGLTIRHRLINSQLKLRRLADARRNCLVMLEKLKELPEPSVTLTAEAMDHMGTLHRFDGKYDSALVQHLAAMNMRLQTLDSLDPKMSLSYNKIGIAYEKLEQFDRALSYHEKGAQILIGTKGPDTPNLAVSYANMATIYYHIGRYEKALELHQKVLRIDRLTLPDDHIYMALTFNNMGLVYLKQGVYDLALQSQQKSLRITEKQLGKINKETANAYLNVGAVHYEQRNFDEAIRHYQEALVIYQEIFGQSHFSVATAYNNLGNCYDRLRQYRRALTSHQLALKIREAVFRSPHSQIGDSYNNIGNIYRSLGFPDSASFYLHRGLKVRQQVFGKRHPLVAISQANIASIYRDSKQYDSAVYYYEQSIAANLKRTDGVFDPAQKIRANYFEPDVVAKSMARKGATYFDQYQEQGGVDVLQNALQDLEQYDELVDQIKNDRTILVDKLELSGRAADVFTMAAVAYRLLFQQTAEHEHLERAFYFSEKARSSVLTQAVHDLEVRKLYSLPDSLTNYERRLRSSISYSYGKVLDMEQGNVALDSAYLGSLKDELLAFNLQLDAHLKFLDQNYPQYYHTKYVNQLTTLKEVQEKLPANGALIEYVLEDSVITAFAITSDTAIVTSVPNRLHQDQLLETFSKSLRYDYYLEFPDEAQALFQQSAHGLYKVLLHPILSVLPQSVDRLQLIPAAEISTIPFDLLIDEPEKHPEAGFLGFNYLLRRYAISYGHTATSLFKDKQRRKSKLEMLSFAPSYSQSQLDSIQVTRGVGDDLQPLFWNKKEVEQLATFVSGTPLFGEEATEGQFKSLKDDYAIMHLAMHAFADEQDPMKSGLIFARDAGEEEDGTLYAYELYNMSLQADLAVLSACNTGTGSISRGEGVMSLARAFSYAGCPSVVMSHWAVNDEATAVLMAYFYEAMAGGMDKDEALQKAKLDFIKEKGVYWSHPMYWGSFVLTGDRSSFRSSPFDGALLWVVLAAVGGVVFFVFFLRGDTKKSGLNTGME